MIESITPHSIITERTPKTPKREARFNKSCLSASLAQFPASGMLYIRRARTMSTRLDTSRAAIAALVLGITTCITLAITVLLLWGMRRAPNEFNDGILVAILVIPISLEPLLLSLVALRQIKRSRGQIKGRGFAQG